MRDELRMLKEQFEELKHTGQLPSPSGVGLRILVETSKEDCSIDEVVRTIQADPALTGRILKLARAALYSDGSVTDVKDAAMRLGLRTVSNVALGFTLVSGNRSGRCRSFDYDHYWSWSLANAVAAQAIGTALSMAAPTEAFTCGLLSRIGQLALASVHPGDYADVLDRAAEADELSLLGLERLRFRIDHREVTAAMFGDWGLPDSFGAAIELHGRMNELESLEDPRAYELVRVLNASTVLADLCMEEADGQHRHLERLGDVRRDLELEQAAFDALVAAAVASWREWGEVLRVPTGYVMPLEDLRRIEERRRQIETAEPDGNRPLRILAVDDDPVSLRLLRKHLESAGHVVTTAPDGKRALAAALETQPQIVVTDWMMPEMDGLQLCKALRSYGAGRSMYVLLLTGRGEEDRVVEAFEAGVDDYIVKPFKPKLLLARIRAGRRVVELQDQVERDEEVRRGHVSKLAVLNRRLRAAALTDPLTDLPNRRYAMRRLDKEWATSSRSRGSLALITLDIDHFKRVNDTYGHDVGDAVLKSTAKAILRTLRRNDTCARMGGEEFLVVCPATDREGALALAERIRVAVEGGVSCGPDGEHGVTVSLGVAVRGPEVRDVEHLYKLSDEAVYRAKQAGRNRVCEPPPDERRRSA